MSEIWANYVLQLQDSSIKIVDIVQSLLKIRQDEPEIIEQSFESLKKLRPDLAGEVILFYDEILA